MAAQLRTNKKAMKIFYKVMNTPKELRQKNKPYRGKLPVGNSIVRGY